MIKGAYSKYHIKPVVRLALNLEFLTFIPGLSSHHLPENKEDESTGHATPLPGGYSLSYTSINE